MAKILNSTNHLNDDVAHLVFKRKDTLKSMGILFLIAVIIVFLKIPFISDIINFIATITIVVQGFRAIKITGEINKRSSGVEGESLALQILSRLPDNYSIATDLKVSDDEGRTSQIDVVVVGNNGIFIVEVKNMNGNIVGNSDNKDFVQFKTGRKGGKYSKTFYNPIKQVRTHTFRLSQFLKRNGFKYNIKDSVLFTNSNVTISINNSTTTNIFSFSNGGDRELLDFILNNNNINISNEDKEKIEQLLIKCVIQK